MNCGILNHKFVTLSETVSTPTGTMTQGRYGLIPEYAPKRISYFYCERCHETRPAPKGK